ncbi:helix-hairpin-helix domain-containing protein [Dehalococcoides mccartyi]|nr:helix-hairpin-helix domain-containing protein [Dehalococcoides mccartyi]
MPDQHETPNASPPVTTPRAGERKSRLMEGIALVGVVALTVVITLWISRDSERAGVEVFSPPPSAVTFQISGEVVRPGVYSLEGDPRINDAIDIAGGFTPNAESDSINLALHVRDGAKVVIPSLTSPSLSKQSNTGNDSENIGTVGESSADSQPTILIESTGLIDLNTATKDQLIALPGIGDVRADSIIEWRANNLIGSASDLLAISGIGPATVDSIRDLVVQP